MFGRGVSLADLVEGWRFPAHPDHVDEAEDWRPHDESGSLGESAFLQAEAICRLTRAGLFDCARRLLGLTVLERARLRRHDGWLAFLEAIHVACTIDSFLAALEGDRRAAGLARA